MRKLLALAAALCLLSACGATPTPVAAQPVATTTQASPPATKPAPSAPVVTVPAPVPSPVSSGGSGPTIEQVYPSSTCSTSNKIERGFALVVLEADCPQGAQIALRASWQPGGVIIQVNGTPGNAGGFGLPLEPGEYYIRQVNTGSGYGLWRVTVPPK